MKISKMFLIALAVFTGWDVADYVSRYTHLIPGYGQSHGDDPIALAVWILVAGSLVFAVNVRGRKS